MIINQIITEEEYSLSNQHDL